jgi:hypothetical protein
MTSSIITNKFHGETHPGKIYMAMIHCLGAPMLTRVPSLVSIDSNHNCKVIIENCAPYEVVIQRNDIMGLIEIKEDEMYPLMDETTAEIWSSIKSNLLVMTFQDDATSRYQRSSSNNSWTYFSSTRMISAWTNTTWGWPRTKSTGFTPKTRIRSTRNNSKFLRLTITSSNKPWRSVSN